MSENDLLILRYGTYFLCHPICIRVWRIGNRVHHIIKVTPRRARLVLRLVTFGGSSIPVFIQATQAHSAWPSLCRSVQWVLVMVLGHLWGRNGEFCVLQYTLSPGLLAYMYWLIVTLAIAKVKAFKGDELPRDGPLGLW